MIATVRRSCFAALLGICAAVPGQAAVVAIHPATTSAAVGQSVLVDVDISDLVDGAAPSLGAFDIDLHFDPAVLTLTQLTFGDGLNVLGLGGNPQEVTEGTGVVNAFELSLDASDDLNTLQSGAFTLFTLTFQAISAGTAELSLTLNSLANAEAFEIAATSAGSSIEVAPVPLPAAVWMLLSGLVGLARVGAVRARA